MFLAFDHIQLGTFSECCQEPQFLKMILEDEMFENSDMRIAARLCCSTKLTDLDNTVVDK